MKYPFDSLRFWIGLFLFSVYLLSFSGKFHVMDELAVFAAGNNLAQHGRADINPLVWSNHWTPNPPGIWGRDGNLYTKKAPGISFITAPLIWLGHRLPDLNAVHVGLLTNALVTALTASLLFIWLTDLGFARPPAALTALAYGLGTIAWIYARMFWESSLLALSFLLAVWAVFRCTRLAYARQRLFWILLAGLAIGLGLTLRFETLPAILFLALYIVWESAGWHLRQISGTAATGSANAAIFQPATPGRGLLLFLRAIPWGRLVLYAGPILLFSLALLYFNAVRYGSLSETGYTQELLFQAPWEGGFGLLFSPGRGLFIYAPITLLLFFGLRPAWRRLSPAYFWLVAGLCLFYWLFYGSWFAWGGTWGWGPRFLLPILPLLMLFVAEPIAWAYWQSTNGKNHDPAAGRRVLGWLGIGLLALLSLIVNFLGLAVDFNEHFLRLGRNDNFVFNWGAFPPLAHWRILQEGQVDIIWVREGFAIEWAILMPSLILLVLAAAGLGLSLRDEFRRPRNNGAATHPERKPPASTARPILYALLFIVLPVTLTYQTMTNTARLALEHPQAQADIAVLNTLAAAAQPDDALLVPMPPFADVQEFTTLLMAYLDQSLPTAAWIESEPRAIQPAEREQVAQATLASADRIWLFERWLSRTGPTTPTAAWLNAHAFPVREQWFEQSGKLTLYAVAETPQTAAPVPLNVPFEGGLTLLDYTLLNPTVKQADDVLKLRLTWRAAQPGEVAHQRPITSIVAFIQLLSPQPEARNVAQSDRILLDLHNFEQSPLLPGQTVQTGYGLPLPVDLMPGRYPLIVGLYEANTGRRFVRADGSPDDFLYLTDVVVE